MDHEAYQRAVTDILDWHREQASQLMAKMEEHVENGLYTHGVEPLNQAIAFHEDCWSKIEEKFRRPVPERQKFIPSIHPCIWVHSSWYLEDGMPHSSRCCACGSTKPGARYIVNTYSGVSRMEFFCHECQRRREGKM